MADNIWRTGIVILPWLHATRVKCIMCNQKNAENTCMTLWYLPATIRSSNLTFSLCYSILHSLSRQFLGEDCFFCQYGSASPSFDISTCLILNIGGKVCSDEFRSSCHFTVSSSQKIVSFFMDSVWYVFLLLYMTKLKGLLYSPNWLTIYGYHSETWMMRDSEELLCRWWRSLSLSASCLFLLERPAYMLQILWAWFSYSFPITSL